MAWIDEEIKATVKSRSEKDVYIVDADSHEYVQQFMLERLPALTPTTKYDDIGNWRRAELDKERKALGLEVVKQELKAALRQRILSHLHHLQQEQDIAKDDAAKKQNKKKSAKNDEKKSTKRKRGGESTKNNGTLIQFPKGRCLNQSEKDKICNILFKVADELVKNGPQVLAVTCKGHEKEKRERL